MKSSHVTVARELRLETARLLNKKQGEKLQVVLIMHNISLQAFIVVKIQMWRSGM